MNLKLVHVNNALFDDRERFLKEGFDAYFSKPINKEHIIKTIHQDYAIV